MPSTRIRSIKPEFWTLPSTECLSYPARILRAAMHNCANDHGYGETNLYQLLGVAFPESDKVTLDDLKGYLCEIAEHCNTIFYSVTGRHFFCVTDWDDHQQIKKRGKQWCPPLDHPDTVIDQRFHPSVTDFPGNSGESQGIPGIPPIRTGEQGISGTGERGNSGTEDQRIGGSVDLGISGAEDIPDRCVLDGGPGETFCADEKLADEKLRQLEALKQSYPDEFEREKPRFAVNALRPGLKQRIRLVECVNCSTEFEAVDPRAKYCSPACKQAHYRKQRKP
jgi:hypothetical protein